MPPSTVNKGLALALLASTQFVLILDAAIVGVALPSIGRDLDFAREDLSWVANAYTLMFGGFLLLGGRIADLVGRRRMFVAGLVLFTAASLFGALAQSALWLVLARAGQGLGAALISPAALSLVMTLFTEGSERNKALGVWGAVAGSGGAAGRDPRRRPHRVARLGGGALRERADRPGRRVPRPAAPARRAARRPARARSTSPAPSPSRPGSRLLVYALVDANDAGWGSAQTLGLIAVALALLALFVAIERRAPSPARAAGDLPQPRAARGEHRERRDDDGVLPDVLLPDLLRAVRARLRADRGRVRAAADRAVDHRVRRRGVAGRHARGVQDHDS